jgi:UDP-N-acetylglucosamine 2-epimerase (non-hydrolysing)
VERRRILVVFGTRPEAIKLAPVIQLLERDERFEPIVVITAQHREMLDQVLELFCITADHDLAIQRKGQTLAGITTRALAGLDRIIATRRPDVLVVQGDTTSSFAGALAGFYHRVPVVHVEAGLRTTDRYSPYPEEINRRLITQLATLHLPPTHTAVANLRAGGVSSAEIVCTGNTVIDALFWAVNCCTAYDDPALDGIDEDPRRVIVATIHRRESWGARLEGIARALAQVALDNPGLLLVIPLHRNPTVRAAVLPAMVGVPNVQVIEPLPYGAFCRLMQRADLLVTDSGGIQEEAPSLGKPVLVLRDTTERPEAVVAGTVKLIGTDEGRVADEIRSLLTNADAYEEMAMAINPYGDGRSAERSTAAIAWLLGEGDRPDDFVPVLGGDVSTKLPSPRQ